VDSRVHGKLTKRLERLAAKAIDEEDLVEMDIPLERENGTFTAPDCATCEDSCCVHQEVGSGILLSLRDVANLIDSGLEDLIVGTFTFEKSRKGKIKKAIDLMPRLAKKQGNCIFYDPETKLCTGYGYRPTICRRFPYEVHHRKRSGEPFARFIPWAPCPRLHGEEHEQTVLQMVRDSVHDENISYEDVVLLADHHEELRKMGFAKVLPPRSECP
jgi:Fe-S-cluster containining protein